MDKNQLIAAITQMKKEKNAIILAHYYSDPDIQDICDFLVIPWSLLVKRPKQMPILLSSVVYTLWLKRLHY